jgi:hypothetical protein
MKAATKKPRKRKYLTHEQLNAMPLHKLLAVGLRDLRKQELTPGCEVNMFTWLHRNKRKRTCTACLAGSVLRSEIRNPFHFWENAEYVPDWMDALDDLRQGMVGNALHSLGRATTFGLNRWIPDYDGNRIGWWKAMRQLHADLKKAGL